MPHVSRGICEWLPADFYSNRRHTRVIRIPTVHPRRSSRCLAPIPTGHLSRRTTNECFSSLHGNELERRCPLPPWPHTAIAFYISSGKARHPTHLARSIAKWIEKSSLCRGPYTRYCHMKHVVDRSWSTPEDDMQIANVSVSPSKPLRENLGSQFISF